MVHLTRAGLDRRLKRHLLKKKQRFLAIAAPGFEKILEEELRSLPEVSIDGAIRGGVEFRGPLALAYQANLKLRTANRVLMRVDSFTARSYPELYNKARRISWELYCGFGPAVSFEATSRASRLHHTANIAKAVREGCADHMAALGVALCPGAEACIRFFIRLADDTCTISLDSSGEPLHKRGYRPEAGRAPLRETTAAALLLHSPWDGSGAIADPLCGSGTFCIEAARLCRNLPPGLNRSFAFERWPSFKPSFWERIRREAAAQAATVPSPRIIGSDVSGAAIDRARRNAERAGVRDSIVLACKNCFDFNKDGSAGESGLIISNLPYGKRAFAGSSDMRDFYKEWGAHLRKYCRGWRFGFVVADPSFASTAGLPAESALHFENGGLNVHFVSGRMA